MTRINVPNGVRWLAALLLDCAAAVPARWTIVSMKRDWKRIFAFDH
jgi:hypothetical protein